MLNFEEPIRLAGCEENGTPLWYSGSWELMAVVGDRGAAKGWRSMIKSNFILLEA